MRRARTSRERYRSFVKDYRAAFISPNAKLLGPKYKFKKVGKNGTELGELLPHLGEVVDDIAIVKSMVTDAFNHAPAQLYALMHLVFHPFESFAPVVDFIEAAAVDDRVLAIIYETDDKLWSARFDLETFAKLSEQSLIDVPQQM